MIICFALCSTRNQKCDQVNVNARGLVSLHELRLCYKGLSRKSKRKASLLDAKADAKAAGREEARLFDEHPRAVEWASFIKDFGVIITNALAYVNLTSFFPSFLSLFLLSFLPSFLPFFLPFLSSFPFCLPSFLPSFLPSCLPSSFPTRRLILLVHACYSFLCFILLPYITPLPQVLAAAA